MSNPVKGWSPVDSREAVPGKGPGPNTAVVDAQGNQIFTGQTSSNGSVPGVDSRAAGAPQSLLR